MFFCGVGVAAFLLFYFYDFNTVYFSVHLGRKCFLAGALLLIFATLGIISDAAGGITVSMGFVLAILISVIFLLLLIYTLFFAFPSDTAAKAYSGTLTDENKVYRDGMYALCRHPGVLWFAGFYMMLGVALATQDAWRAAIAWTLLDVLYVILQDGIIFPKQFTDYDDYKKTTPFLIPTPGSIKRAFGKAH